MRPQPAKPAPESLRRAVLWTIFALIAFFAADAALFRLPWYNRFLEPDSTAGEVEYRLLWLHRAKRPAQPDVLAIGDSRVAEGFSAQAAQAATGNAIHFVNFGMGGSAPRVWYYTLRDADPQRNRFAAIAIALPRYSDEDGVNADQDRPMDLNYVIYRLRLTDCPDFALSFNKKEAGWEAFTGCLFRGIVLRRDVRDFLSSMHERLSHAKDWRNNGAGYVDGYRGKPEDLAGLSIDWATKTLHFPPGVKDWQTGSIQGTMLPPEAPQTGDATRYREMWLGRILDLYKGSSTRVIFLELPRGPLPVREGRSPARFIDSVRARSGVTVLPAETFRDLERPELFADGLHLNHAGRPIFSERLARKVQEILGVRSLK